MIAPDKLRAAAVRADVAEGHGVGGMNFRGQHEVHEAEGEFLVGRVHGHGHHIHEELAPFFRNHGT